MFSKESEYCHVCSVTILHRKGEPMPPVCPACGTDLANPDSEVTHNAINCEYLKGALGLNVGEMLITSKRLLWVSRKDNETGNALVGSITGKNANKVPVSIPLEEIVRISNCKKLLRVGITVYAKNGASYNFYLVNRGNPQLLKDFIAPYVSNNVFES